MSKKSKKKLGTRQRYVTHVEGGRPARGVPDRRIPHCGTAMTMTEYVRAFERMNYLVPTV